MQVGGNKALQNGREGSPSGGSNKWTVPLVWEAPQEACFGLSFWDWFFVGFFWSLVRPLADFGLVVIATFVVPLD